MKENERKFRGYFFPPLRTVGNPKSFLGEKKEKEKLTLFNHLWILLQNQTSTMKKNLCIYISEEECQINISQEWLRIIFLFDMMPLVFILFLVGG